MGCWRAAMPRPGTRRGGVPRQGMSAWAGTPCRLAFRLLGGKNGEDLEASARAGGLRHRLEIGGSVVEVGCPAMPTSVVEVVVVQGARGTGDEDLERTGSADGRRD